MKTLRFKTNFKCQGCINKVQPYLDDMEGVKSWHVEDKKGHKELIVEADENVEDQNVTNAVASAGYRATEKKGGLMGKLFS